MNFLDGMFPAGGAVRESDISSNARHIARRYDELSIFTAELQLPDSYFLEKYTFGEVLPTMNHRLRPPRGRITPNRSCGRPWRDWADEERETALMPWDPRGSMITHRQNRGELRPAGGFKTSEDWRDSWLARAPGGSDRCWPRRRYREAGSGRP